MIMLVFLSHGLVHTARLCHPSSSVGTNPKIKQAPLLQNALGEILADFYTLQTKDERPVHDNKAFVSVKEQRMQMMHKFTLCA